MHRKIFIFTLSIMYLLALIVGCGQAPIVLATEISESDTRGTDVNMFSMSLSNVIGLEDDTSPAVQADVEFTSGVEALPVTEAPVTAATTMKPTAVKSTTTSTIDAKKTSEPATAKLVKASTQPLVTQPPATQAPTTPTTTTVAPTTSTPTAQPPTTVVPTTVAPTTATPSMSISDLSSSAKSYATSIGMIWDISLNGSNSHWVTPLSSAGFSSADAFKAKINERTRFLQSQGFTNVNIYFEQSGGKILTHHFAG